MEDGSTKEEEDCSLETKKMLDPKIKLTANCVRVPVFIGDSEAVNIEFENPMSAEEARKSCATRRVALVIDKHGPGGDLTTLMRWWSACTRHISAASAPT